MVAGAKAGCVEAVVDATKQQHTIITLPIQLVIICLVYLAT